MSSTSDVVLSDTFTLEGREVVVFLTPNILFWEWKSQLADGYHEIGDSLYRQDHQSIALTDVAAAKAIGSSTDVVPGGEIDSSCNCIETGRRDSALNPETDLSIFYVRRSSGHRWKIRQITFQPSESGVSSKWASTITKRLRDPTFNRPRHLLVFINPLSGKRAAPSIYSQRVAPIFDLAGVTTQVVVTERAGHAQDFLLQEDLTSFSGVVCVGGDGMFSELVHGLLLRTRQDEGFNETDHSPESPEVRPHLRIGVIPAGSTDTVVFTVNGCSDPVTSALHILVGDSVGLDVISVHSEGPEPKFLRYNLSLLGYGFYGDIIANCEALRWMGPARYDWLGFKQFCKLRRYCGEVMFRSGGGSPLEGGPCMAGCSTCCAPEAAQIGEWETVKGEFVAVNSFLISCRCNKALDGVATNAHLGNGYTDLILVGDCSRYNYLKHLLRISNRSGGQFDFNFMRVVRVSEFRFRPLSSATDDDDGPESPISGDAEGVGQSRQCLRRPQVKVKSNSAEDRVSCWNCDGEAVQNPALRCKVHRQLIVFFGRGVEEDEKEKRCPNVCGSRYWLGCGRVKRM